MIPSLIILIAILAGTVLFLLINARATAPDGYMIYDDSTGKRVYTLEFDDDLDLEKLDARKRLILEVKPLEEPVLEDRS